MKRAFRGLVAALSLVVACKRSNDSSHTRDAPDLGPSVAPSPQSSGRPQGMADPFVRLSGEQGRLLDAGYQALRARKYDEARDAFAKVAAAVPDYTAARFQQIQALALGGHAGDVPPLWSELLARDFVAYAGRLDRPKELAALRSAPEWAGIKATEAAARMAFATGLDRGFLVVARSREPESEPSGRRSVAALDLHQEAYQYDPATRFYRRLTETGGHVSAINLSPDRRRLMFLSVDKARHDGAQVRWVAPRAGLVDLGMLETRGPFALPDADQVSLWFTSKGEPIWSAGGRSFSLDPAGTRLVEVNPTEAALAVTWATPVRVDHGSTAVAGVSLSPDRLALQIAGVAEPVRAARPINLASITWAPGRRRLAYAGKLNPCQFAGGKPGKDDQNELFYYDLDRKLAVRVAQAPSTFAAVWLDDDHLVYQGGFGGDARLDIYEVSTRNDTALRPRHGAGLFGDPSLQCDEPPADSDDDDGD